MVELVELQTTVSYKNDIFNKFSLLENDKLRVKELLKRHINYTNSNIARFLLENFDEEFENFVKILPTDFKKALRNNETANEKATSLWQK